MFTIHRGTNISHWLSQSNRRGEERQAWFLEEDVKQIAAWGFDHLRLPIDEEQMWDEAGQPEPAAFELLDQALDWAKRAGLRVIVDLHILRSHHFNQGTPPTLYTDPAEAQRFADLWRKLSQHLRSRSTDWVAYELLNEPVAKDPEDWNRVSHQALAAVREEEPGRQVVLGSNWFQVTDMFDRLAVPADPNLILSFHFYNPMLITHHQASWWRDGAWYAGPIQYPGTPVSDEAMAKLTAEEQQKLAKLNGHFDAAAMEAALVKPLAVKARTGLPLYCGEFGVLDTVPAPIRARWYRDFMAVLAKHGIAFANWDYRGRFGLADGQRQATGVAPWLLGQ